MGLQENLDKKRKHAPPAAVAVPWFPGFTAPSYRNRHTFLLAAISPARWDVSIQKGLTIRTRTERFFFTLGGSEIPDFAAREGPLFLHIRIAPGSRE